MQRGTTQHGLVFPLQPKLIDRDIRGGENGNHAGQRQRLGGINA